MNPAFLTSCASQPNFETLSTNSLLPFNNNALLCREYILSHPIQEVKEGVDGKIEKRKASSIEHEHQYVKYSERNEYKLYVKYEDTEEVNQLQFVSWQLRCEPKGLARKYNDIVISARIRGIILIRLLSVGNFSTAAR